jgi:threonine/homoserine/homoserine lactone efflux protein
VLALGVAFSLMTFAWLTAYSFVVAKVGDILRRGAVRRVLDALTGVALIGLGVRVATDRA